MDHVAINFEAIANCRDIAGLGHGMCPDYRHPGAR